jgi:hypothetical protein
MRLSGDAARRRQDEIQNGVAWKCDGDACRGSQGGSRAEVVCARLAREFGEVTAFTAKGKSLEGEALAKCNGEKADPARPALIWLAVPALCEAENESILPRAGLVTLPRRASSQGRKRTCSARGPLFCS